MSERYDVVIVGAGNAAFSAAHAARERGRKVLMLEKAPKAWAGGNSYFTAGAIRTTFDGLDDLLPIVENVTEDQARTTDLDPYTTGDFRADMERVTEGRCDTELTRVMIENAADTIRWLYEKGLRYRLMYDRQSFEVGGRRRFWGGLVLGTVDGGEGLIRQHTEAAERTGIEIRYRAPVVGLLRDGSRVSGVEVLIDGERHAIEAGSVILCAGGFEANPQMRAMYLGPQWDVAKVRGTPFNTGEVLRMALDAGAAPYGNWSGCHAIAWDKAAPETGDRELTNRLSRQSYPLGIVVNREAQRFIDEGADFRNYTYAKYGVEILRQPGALAYQIFDAKTEPLLRQDEYTATGVSRHEATSIGELAEQMSLDAASLEKTVEEFNAATLDVEFNPAIKDGKGTNGISPPKSNWALPIDTAPFYGFPVTCGITFTFGGLRISRDAQVLDWSGGPIPGLFAAGELVGGLFYHNYPGGSGLTSGAVFGRRAGASAVS